MTTRSAPCASGKTTAWTTGSAFQLELFDCELFTFVPYEGAAIDDPEQITCDIVEAESEAGHLTVRGSTGSLRLRCGSLAIRFDTGAPLALVALERAVREYWLDWARSTASRS